MSRVVVLSCLAASAILLLPLLGVTSGQEIDYDELYKDWPESDYYREEEGEVAVVGGDGGGGEPILDQERADLGGEEHEGETQEDSDRHQQQQDASEDHGGSDMGGGGGGGGGGPKTCGKCIQEECAAPVSCLAGVTVDRCGCCLECARSEGELCDDPESGPGGGRYGACGDNLRCTRRTDVDDPPEWLCACRVDKMVCGSDKRTYGTICELNEEAARRGKPDRFNPQLLMEYWGPCKEAPVIISPPRDSYGPLGANLTLDCEARGNPAPEISWRFVSAKGETVTLPNDDQSVSIQMRGGPEPMMVTGWAQIMALDPDYIGVYHCIATNTEGQVYAMASVGVYKREL